MIIRSAFLTEMSGKLGGAVGSTARGGIQYLRKLVIPRNPRTLLQTAIRNAVASASAYWANTLSEANQQAWWDLAEGAQTGKSLFSKVNQPRVFGNNSGLVTGPTGVASIILQEIIEAPPDTLSVEGQLPLAVIDDSANTLTITFDPTEQEWAAGASAPAVAVMYIYVTGGQNASRFSRQHPYRLARAYALVDPEIAVANAINLAALGIATVAGKVYYVKSICQAIDGRVSVPQEQRIVAVA